MPDDLLRSPWRRMRRAGLLLSATCAVLLALQSPPDTWLNRQFFHHLPADVAAGLPALLTMGVAGGTLAALLAIIRLRRPPNG